MNFNVCKFFIVPTIRINPRESQASGQDNDIDITTIPLLRCSRTLDVLLTEYEFGIGGNKLAKLFTARERGKVTFSYSLSKPFWKLVERMICYGYSHTTAIEKIEWVYCSDRSKCVSQVLREIRKDSRREGNPALNYI